MYLCILFCSCDFGSFAIYTRSSHQSGCYKISSSSNGGDGPDIDNVGKFLSFADDAGLWMGCCGVGCWGCCCGGGCGIVWIVVDDVCG